MTLSSGSETSQSNFTVIQAGSGDITVGDGNFLFNAEFIRSGSDLIISGADGAKVIVIGYFKAGSPANLLSDGGAMLSGELVDILAGPQAPGQYAQNADSQDGPAPIGAVVSATGNVAATRADGTSVTLVEGAPVFAGDVILTATASTVSLTFLDGTVFNMAESARMVLNNLVYEAGGSNNSMLFNLLQGGFTFFAGQIAPTGDMQVTTPVATLGIRGTSPTCLIASGGAIDCSILPDPITNQVGSYTLFSLISGQPIAIVNNTSFRLLLTSADGVPQQLAKTPGELAADQIQQQQLTDTFNSAQPIIQQLQGGQIGPGGAPNNGQQRGDLNDGTQEATSAPIPAAGPSPAPVQSSGINAADISEAQSEDIQQTQTTTENSFALEPLSTASGTQSAGGSGFTTSNLLNQTSDDTSVSEPAPGGETTTIPPPEPDPTPVIILPDAPTISEDTSIVLSGFDISDNTGSNLDVEITAMSTVTLASIEGLTFLVGDGVDDEFLVFQGSAEAINNALNGLIYIPTADNDIVGGLDIVVSNGIAEASGTLTVVINGINDAPDAVDDAATVIEGGSLGAIAVLDNDIDVDGDTLSVVSATAANGTVSINPDNTLNYTPDDGFTGTDTIIYSVSDGASPEPLMDTANVSVDVTPDTSNSPPAAGDDTAKTDEDTALDAIAVLVNDTDADGDPLTVTGATALNGTVVVNPDNTIAYTPNADFFGTDTIIYDLSDGNGGTDMGAVTVTVNPVNDSPVAGDDAVVTDEDTPLDSIDVLTSDVDADGDPLSVTSASAEFGTVAINGDGTLNYTPLADFNGTDTITYTVSDGNGGTDTGTVDVTVDPVNDAPVADNDTASTDEDTAIEAIDVLTNDSDTDGGPLTVISATASKGAVTINTDGTLRFDPAGQFDNLSDGEVPDTATATITYTVSDGAGGTDTGTVTVTVIGVNDDPVAVDDAFTTDGTTVLNGDLFADNGAGTDSDVDEFDFIEVVEVDGITGSVGEPIDLESGATVTVNFDGTFSYDAVGIFDSLGAGESTTETFTYTISDFNGGTDTATVNITIEGKNDPPVADDETAATNEDTTIASIDVLDGDTDIDGDTLFISSASAASGTVGTNSDGTLNYTPNANFNGTDTITYTVGDGNGGFDDGTVTVTVNPVNDNPVADDETAETNEDTTIASIDVLTGDTDVDGDTLTVFEATALHGTVGLNDDGTINYTPDADFNGTDTITYSIHDGNDGTDTGEVTVTVAPVADIADDTAATAPSTSVNIDVLANDSFENEFAFISGFTQGANGSVFEETSGGGLTYTPNEGFTGTDTFEYTVTSNGVMETATVTVTVSAGNSPPMAVDDMATAVEDITLSNIDVLGNDSDPDEDSLTVTAVSASNGSVEINTDGTLNYTPNANFNGTDTITYTIDDGNGGTDEGDVTVTVNPVNDQPFVDKGLVNQSTLAGIAISYAIPADAFGDVDTSDTLTFTAQLAGGGDLPDWLTFNGTTFSGLPDALDGGAITIEVKATDSGGLATSSVFDLAVNPTIEGTPDDDPTLIGTVGNDFIDGLAGNDVIDGLAGNDLIIGGDGNDIIRSGGANLDWEGLDRLRGGAGDDELISQGGFSIMTGGAGNDTITVTTDFSGDEFWDWAHAGYKTSTAGIYANLTGSIILASASGLPVDLAQGEVWDGFGTVDQIGNWNGESIDDGVHVIRDSANDDQIFIDGNYFNNFGNWIEVRLSAGDDHVDFTGMFGTSRISWQNALGGVNASLETGIGKDVNSADNFIGTDTFIGATYLRGSRHDDMLFGNSDNNAFRGLDGNDFIDGGRGTNRIDFNSAPTGILVDLSLTSNQVIDDGHGTTDDLVNIQNVRGGLYDDQITGGALDNRLEGREDHDILKGGAGFDVLIGDIGDRGGLLGGDDILDGGAGFDVLTGGDGADVFVLRPGADTDIITDFNISQGDKIDVTAYGFSSADEFAARGLSFDGTNTTVNPDGNGAFVVQNVDLTGDPNSHFIFSTDVIAIDQFAAGDFDLIFDGAFYTLDFNNDPETYGVTMVGTPTSTAFSLENAADPNRITNFTGTGFTYDGSFNLTGGTIDQISFAGISATPLADVFNVNVSAVAFFDALAIAPDDNGAALDALFLTSQFDYAGGTNDENFAGGFASDIITGGGGADILEGDAGGDWIEGEAGNDFIDGGDGDDTLRGGLDDDVLVGGAGADIYEWQEGDGFDTVQSSGDNAKGDIVKILGFEHFDANWTWDANDLFVGKAIDGNYDFNDTGSIRIEGFRSGPSSVAYFELDTVSNNFYSQDDTISRIYLTSGTEGINQGGYTELVVGTEGNDVITGGGGFRDYLNGAGGDDIIMGDDETRSDLHGGDGADELLGAANVDRMAGQAGIDILDGGDGRDMARYDLDNGPDGVFINLSAADATALFEGGLETVAAGTAIDSWDDIDTLISVEDVRGTDLADVIVGGSGANALNGRDGDDLLIGGAGMDTTSGGAGADTFVIDPADVGIGDLITDYLAGEGDVVDLTELFEVITAEDGSIRDYARIEPTAGGTLQVDTDGFGTGQTWEDVASLDTSGGVNILYTQDGSDTSTTL